MASNSPDTENRIRKQSISQLRRDQPLFATRRFGPSRQPPDFFTDSLNTTAIPSPSPTKSASGKALGAKPRQALDVSTRRSLAAAFKATTTNDENRPFQLSSSASSSDHQRTEQIHKPRPTQIPTRGPSRPVSKAESRKRVETPSPPRGRQLSLVSPLSSASSPPRGLAEAYQRIDDEESLAQEESIDDMEPENFEYSHQDGSREIDRLRLQRLQDSVSPISSRASRRASPYASAEKAVMTGEQGEMKISLRGSDSGSVRSSLDNVTDGSIETAGSQHARDAQRLHGVLQGQVFRKARGVGERIGLTVENLRRRNGSNESLGTGVDAGSTSSRGSDPSLNVPRDWARKARPGKDWLSRINNRSGRLTGDTPKTQQIKEPMAAESERREWEEPIDSWINTAPEVPLPMVEDGSSQAALSSRGSTPTMAAQRDKSLSKILEWEINEDEFTGRSLQASDSPPIRIRNAALDRIREREIESLEKRAVTTSRLGELREKTSEEYLRRRTPSVEDLRLDHVNETPQRRRLSVNSPLKAIDENVNREQTLEAPIENKGELKSDSPVVIYRNTSHNTNGEDQRKGLSRSPKDKRSDSRDLLKNLARATSASPGPAKNGVEPKAQRAAIDTEEEQTNGIVPKDKAEERDQTGNHRGQVETIHQRLQAEIAKKEKHTPQPAEPIVDLKTPIVTSAWIDKQDETTMLAVPSINMMTPFVTGGWIDTPLPTGGRGPPMPTPSDLEDEKDLTMNLDEEIRKLASTDLIRKLNPSSPSSRPKLKNQQPLKNSGPPLPKSSLEAIITAAKSRPNPTNPQPRSQNSDLEEDPTLLLGDSTIQSLEEILEQDTSFSTLLAPSPTTTTTPPDDDNNNDHNEIPQTASQKSRLSDLKVYSNLTSRLNALVPSLRSTKSSLASLERAVSAPPKQRSLSTFQNECVEAGEFHDFIWPCARCGCPGSGDWAYGMAAGRASDSLWRGPMFEVNVTTLSIPVPRLWKWRNGDWRPRLTWLGVATAVMWGLWFAEQAACNLYCHPLYANAMDDYGVDINAPEPPFVLFQVLYRLPIINSILYLPWLLISFLARALSAIVGYFVGFMFGDDGHAGGVATGTIREPVSRDPRIPRPRWGPDLSLMDDEYL